MSVLAYLVLFALSAWGARTFAHNLEVMYLFQFYGLFLLANLIYETSVGVLHTTDQFKQVAHANFYQSIVVTILIVAAFILDLGILGILTAYLIGKAVAGIMVALFAFREMNNTLGKEWVSAPLTRIADWKSILRFA